MIRPSDISASRELEGKAILLSYRDQLPSIQAALIVYALMDLMCKEISTPAYHLACKQYNLPAVPEGYVLLDRVLHHLELELRRN
jgi:hypothetical protein